MVTPNTSVLTRTFGCLLFTCFLSTTVLPHLLKYSQGKKTKLLLNYMETWHQWNNKHWTIFRIYIGPNHLENATVYTSLKRNFLMLYFFNMTLCIGWHDKMSPCILRYKVMAQFLWTYLHVCKPLVNTIAFVSNFHFKNCRSWPEQKCVLRIKVTGVVGIPAKA